MPRHEQRYAVGLMERLLGPAEHEKRFDWACGDPGPDLTHDEVADLASLRAQLRTEGIQS